MSTFEFLYDFGSPNAYLVHKVVPGVEERLGTKVVYSPVLLGGIFKATGNASPAVTLAGIKNKGEYQGIETQRFVKKYGLASSYAPNPHFPVNTLTLMRIATAVRDEDVYQPVIECFFTAMWEDAKKMDEPDVIVDALNQAGLPAAELMDLSTVPENKQALIQLTETAVSRGAFGAPSFLVGEELFFGKDKLRDAEEEYVEQKGS
jgi:2-hydroxychromene-2-carboxylate isomerase